jgi:radical SAM superfamily enzyme YgiQ (UPF0313 family)
MSDQVSPNILIVDASGAGRGKRLFTRDAIGCGTRSIGGVLRQNSISFQIQLAEEVLKRGFPREFTSLFISGMSMDKPAIQKLITKWRKCFQGKVFIGGPVASELMATLQIFRPDILVIGEGEITLKELIKAGIFNPQFNRKELDKIRGIGFFKANGDGQINAFRPYSSKEEFQQFQPDTKCITDYPNFFFSKVYVECVRGCSNFLGTKIELPDGRQCIDCGHCGGEDLEARANCPSQIPPGCGFCSVPSLFGPARSRQESKIVDEITALLEIGVKRIVLSAPDFLDYQRDALVSPRPLINPRFPPANIPAIKKLLETCSNLESFKENRAWLEIENIKANLFTKEIARIFAQLIPNSPLNIGCETGSEEHAEQLGRPTTPEEAFQAVKMAHRYNLKPHVYFIHSLPGQTMKSAKKTVELINKMEPFVEKITIYRFRPLPLSAFGDFPLPPPAVQNTASKMISNAANEVNHRKKKQLIGKTVHVMISEKNFHDPQGAIGIDLAGGPKVAVEQAKDLIGEIRTVQITKVLSDRLVFGVLIE